MENKEIFETLYGVDVSKKIEKKNGLSYLSWAWAWAELKKAYPLATYKVYENVDGWNYFTDGKTCWVKTSVTINELENIEYLPVMDFRNKSIKVGEVTSFDVNKAIQRCLTKSIARHGLGLSLYAGEDLPEDTTKPDVKPPKKETHPKQERPYLWEQTIRNCKSLPELKAEYSKVKAKIGSNKVLVALKDEMKAKLTPPAVNAVTEVFDGKATKMTPDEVTQNELSLLDIPF